MFLDFFTTFMFRGRIVPIGENEQQNMREIRAINFIIFVGLVFYGTLLEPRLAKRPRCFDLKVSMYSRMKLGIIPLGII